MSVAIGSTIVAHPGTLEMNRSPAIVNDDSSVRTHEPAGM